MATKCKSVYTGIGGETVQCAVKHKSTADNVRHRGNSDAGRRIEWYDSKYRKYPAKDISGKDDDEGRAGGDPDVPRRRKAVPRHVDNPVFKSYNFKPTAAGCLVPSPAPMSRGHHDLLMRLNAALQLPLETSEDDAIATVGAHVQSRFTLGESYAQLAEGHGKHFLEPGRVTREEGMLINGAAIAIAADIRTLRDGLANIHRTLKLRKNSAYGKYPEAFTGAYPQPETALDASAKLLDRQGLAANTARDIRMHCMPVPGDMRCSICGGIVKVAFVDGKTYHGAPRGLPGGRWANMCLACHANHGVGLGEGVGFQYEAKDGRWEHVR